MMDSQVRGGDKMLANIGIPGLILMLIIALVVFGPRKLPEIGSAFGRTLMEFKRGTREFTQSLDEKETEAQKPIKVDVIEVSERTDAI